MFHWVSHAPPPPRHAPGAQTSNVDATVEPGLERNANPPVQEQSDAGLLTPRGQTRKLWV